MAQISARFLLCRGITVAVDELQESIQSSPVFLLTQTISADSGNTIDAELNVKETPFGNLLLEMTILSQNQCYAAEGNVSSEDYHSRFSAYLDRNALAVSSDILGEGYYGITFDTFEQDIRSIPLLSWIIQNDMIEEWDKSLQKMKQKVIRDISIPDLSGIRYLQEFDYTRLLMVMPVRIAKVKILQNGNTIPVTRMVYEFRSEQIPNFIRNSVFTANTMVTTFTATFYLYQRQFLMGDILIHGDNAATHIAIEKNITGTEDSIQVNLQTKGEGNWEQELSAVFENSGAQSERWQFSQAKRVLDISCTPDSGKMTLSDREDTHTLFFQKEENGFWVESDDLHCLAKILGIVGTENNWKATCSMHVTKGGNPQVPNYKNLDQWSFEDFLTLLDGIGSLIGWKLA